MITAPLAKAMVTQLDRVNRKEHSLGEADLLDEIDALQADNARLQKRIGELELLLAAYDVIDNAPETPGPAYGQRPTITANEAAQRAGVSLATVTRYVQGGWWEGIPPRRGHNRLLVYSDQPLMSKGTKKRKRGYTK